MIQFDETMSPDDHMNTAGREAYFQTTRSGIAAILAGVTAAGKQPEHIASVLDFGCGYGRIYRALPAVFPAAQITAADLMEPAARFCATTFGGDWVKSSEDLERVRLPRRYDLVWLGSVFTHLPMERWRKLFTFLAGATNPEGLVVFTCHGSKAIKHFGDVVMKRNPYIVSRTEFDEVQSTIDALGFSFLASNDKNLKHLSARGIEVSQGEYGFSFNSESWALEFVNKYPEWQAVDYRSGGWGNNHDVMTMRRTQYNIPT